MGVPFVARSDRFADPLETLFSLPGCLLSVLALHRICILHGSPTPCVSSTSLSFRAPNDTRQFCRSASFFTTSIPRSARESSFHPTLCSVLTEDVLVLPSLPRGAGSTRSVLGDPGPSYPCTGIIVPASWVEETRRVLVRSSVIGLS
ncbi:hypothetical protein K466DRAFT_27753 [Polyporus arcularius HHB13444]|uniref:Uncharacterized protein n=1 Tax=Polyporus arcularius HHB13444 TaxID=1314778 RepID=A0A5C3P0I9_9APHY|nr:hypothetical protein K466DRAFT_27753 [Polyporus arcularius HHB13444]